MPTTNRTRTFRRPLAALAAAAAAWACRSADDGPVPPSAVHAVESERLEHVMHQLDWADRALLPQEIDLEVEWRRRRAAIAELARAIARSTDGIVDALDETALSAGDQEAFVRLARELELEARALEQAALHLDEEALVAEVSALRERCTACHARFRGLPSLR